MQVFEFEGFILDNERRELRAPSGAIIILKSKAFDTLAALVASPGRIISKSELMDTVWPDVTVEENNLNQTILMLRRALGDNRGAPRFIQTVPRQGYLFMPSVRACERPSVEAATTPPAPPPGEAASVAAKTTGPFARFARLRDARMAAVVVGLVVALAVLALAIPFGLRASGNPARASIAILPFENLSSDSAQDYFARGMSVEIMDILSQLDGLDVIDRNSSFAFDANVSARDVGQRISVDHVLSGAVRTGGGQVRISAQLTDARTGKQLWTRTFDRALTPDNLFAVQRLIAQQVSGALSIAFDIDAGSRIAGLGTSSLEAYDFYMRGSDMWFYGGADYTAIELFQRAIEADPNYAAAWAGKAFATLQTSWSAGTVRREQELQAEAAKLARRALELEPDLPAARAVLGVTTYLAGDWKGGQAELDEALAHHRNQTTLAHSALFLLRAGFIQEAFQQASALRTIDPLVNPLSVREDVIRTAMGDTEFGLAQTETFLAATPTQYDIVLPRLITQINARSVDRDIRDSLRRITEGAPAEPARLAADILAAPNVKGIRQRLRQEFQLDTEYPTRVPLLTHLAVWAGDDDLALEIWGKDLRQTPLRAVWIWGPAFSNMRKQTGFRQLMIDIRLADYWKSNGWPDKCRPTTNSDFACF